MQTYRMNCLTWEDYQAKIQGAILILPVGSTEQHSRHLPLGVDAFLAENIALSLADKIGAIVAPTINYGYKSIPTSGGGPLFPGTIDLKGDTFTNLVRDILVEFLDDGWQKILIVNGHFENEPYLIEAADLIFRNRDDDFPKVIMTSWYENISSDLLPEIFNEVEFPGWALEHAAIVETSVMMYYTPDLVHEDRIVDEGLDAVPTYYRFPPSKTLIPSSGSLHTARSSSAEKGKIIVENVMKNINEYLQDEFEM